MVKLLCQLIKFWLGQGATNNSLRFYVYYSGVSLNIPEKWHISVWIRCFTLSYFSPTEQNQQLTSIRENEEVCSTMDTSLGIEGQVAPAGVTEFSNEACEAVELLSNYVGSTITVPQSDLQDIKNYFQRPRLVTRGAFSLGTRSIVYNSMLTTANLATIFPQWAQRLSGAYGIRYKTNLRLQVAATPFHQGVIVTSFQYACTPSIDPYLYNRASISATSTNLPHVRLDLSESTMVELTIPFVYEQEYALVDVNDAGSIGRININVILPLIAVSGLAAPTYELYMYLTDIELFGADNNNPSTITLQSGTSTFGKEVKNARLLSKSLEGVSNISSFVANNIPSLASFAGPVAWATGAASGVARYFGFSRPMIQDPIMRVFKSNFVSEAHVDVPMAGFNVGMMQSNTLEISPEFGGTLVDEMSLDFVTAQWSQLCVGSVASSDTHSKVVYATPVSPSCFWFRAPATAPYCNIVFPKSNTVGATTNAIVPTSIMNISSLFRLWRGGFKFRFTFAKTKFHGGRYMLSFNPSLTQRPDNNSTISTIDGPEVVGGLVQPYGYSQIIDLRDTNVFEFDVPYMTSQPFVTFNSSIGGFSMVCIDPLQSNSSVSSTVPFLVEVCGYDYQLADFAGPWFAPFPAGTILQQSGSVVMKSTTKDPSGITMGEKMMSVKQLIQSPSWVSANAAVGNNFTLLYPWFVSPPVWYLNSVKSTPMPTTVVYGGNTVASYLAKAYAFARGGTDHHVYPPSSTGVRAVVEQVAYDGYFEASSGLKDLAIRQGTCNTPKVLSLGENPLHVRSPAFQPKVRLPAHLLDDKAIPNFGNAPGFSGLNVRGHVDRLITTNTTASSVPIWVSKSAADDAMLSQYIGPVPVLILNGANSVFPDGDWYR